MNFDLVLPAELTVYTAADTRLAWLPLLEAAPGVAEPLHADAAQVAEADACGLQLLAALANGLRARGRALQLHSSSEALAAACRCLGLDSLLDVPARPAAKALP